MEGERQRRLGNHVLSTDRSNGGHLMYGGAGWGYSSAVINVDAVACLPSYTLLVDAGATVQKEHGAISKCPSWLAKQRGVFPSWGPVVDVHTSVHEGVVQYPSYSRRFAK